MFDQTPFIRTQTSGKKWTKYLYPNPLSGEEKEIVNHLLQESPLGVKRNMDYLSLSIPNPLWRQENDWEWTGAAIKVKIERDEASKTPRRKKTVVYPPIV